MKGINRNDPRYLAGTCVLCQHYLFDEAQYSEECRGCRRFYPSLFVLEAEYREWTMEGTDE